MLRKISSSCSFENIKKVKSKVKTITEIQIDSIIVRFTDTLKVSDTIYQKGGANNVELFETSVRFKAKSDRALLTRVAANALDAFAERSVNPPIAGGNTKNPILVDFELKYLEKHLKYSNLYRIIKYDPSYLFKAYTEHPLAIDSKD